MDLVATTVSSIAYVACNTTGLQITARTEYVWSALPSIEDVGRPSPGRTFFQTPIPGPSNYVAFGYAHYPLSARGHAYRNNYSLSTASANLKALLQYFPTGELADTPGRISVQGIPSCSNHPLYSSWIQSYCNSDDTVPVTWLYGGGLESSASFFPRVFQLTKSDPTVYFGFSNGTELPVQYDDTIVGTGPGWIDMGFPYNSPSANVTDAYLPAITDILQLMISSIRLDLGRILPNNPFLSVDIMNETIHNPFPNNIQQLGSASWPTTISQLVDPNLFSMFDMGSFSPENSTYINGEYQCRFWYRVGWGAFKFGSY